MSADELVAGMIAKLGQDQFHTIAPGETLGQLAQQAGIPVQDILDANPGIDPTKLRPGQQVKVPAKTKLPSNNPNFNLDAELPKAAARWNINPQVLKALIQTESSGNPKADNGVAQGLTQLTRQVQ